MTLTDRLQDCYTGAVYDVMKGMGVSDSILPSDIRPTDDSLTLAGQIWTCSGRIDESASADETLMAWTGLLSEAPGGSVVVCQPNDGSLAHMGELSAETLKLRAIRGYVVDGGCRDVDFIRRLEWPVFCRYYTPADVVGRWLAEGLGEPIEIGGVSINTGDYLLADIDGVVVIPEGIAEEVVAQTEEVINTESALRRDILQGMDPQQAYRKYRLF
ncbi:MAG: RraA family protein [Chloroflexi bacterium]|nr:RraA family protein [Chloroflexota bacterium]